MLLCIGCSHCSLLLTPVANSNRQQINVESYSICFVPLFFAFYHHIHLSTWSILYGIIVSQSWRFVIFHLLPSPWSVLITHRFRSLFFFLTRYCSGHCRPYSLFSAFFVCSCTLDYLFGVLTIFFRFSAELSIAISHKTNKCAYMVNIRISVEGTPWYTTYTFKYEKKKKKKRLSRELTLVILSLLNRFYHTRAQNVSSSSVTFVDSCLCDLRFLSLCWCRSAGSVHSSRRYILIFHFIGLTVKMAFAYV